MLLDVCGDPLLPSNNVHVKTPLYSPKSNGRAECLNKMLAERYNRLHKIKSVPEAIKELIWSHRTTTHVSTDVTPFESMRARKAVTKLYPFWLSRWQE